MRGHTADERKKGFTVANSINGATVLDNRSIEHRHTLVDIQHAIRVAIRGEKTRRDGRRKFLIRKDSVVSDQTNPVTKPSTAYCACSNYNGSSEGANQSSNTDCQSISGWVYLFWIFIPCFKAQMHSLICVTNYSLNTSRVSRCLQGESLEATASVRKAYLKRKW